MKNIRSLLAALLFFSTQLIAQTSLDTVHINTSAVCKTCKRTIENYLSFEKGVKSSSLDVKSKVLTVVYNPQKTDAQKIRVAVTKIGYDADSLPRDRKAFDRLPDCCKKESTDPDHH